ncbi:hypothetical protein [Chitinophaga pinensis]|uniref:Caspase family protein n=1 Tax=Chitinophaga pinensis TaxID=79329 RepID=A0A5C6LPC5_9BACT|nr:hypothetical protein [Chitinophaga pinensis]TWV93271.1 hypothetical protein FEF09_27330 [Chitinophaga pinensis]
MGRKMGELQLAGKRGRRLYFYFSGHGIGVTMMNSAMLLPKWTTFMRNYALSSEKYIQELVNKGTFEEIYFFMDCCRNRIPGVNGQPPLFGSPGPAPQPTEYMLCYGADLIM